MLGLRNSFSPADLEVIADSATAKIWNDGISDIVFNHDYSDCRDEDGNWIWGELAAELESVHIMLEATGLPNVPDVRKLVEDFFARM